MLKTSRNCGEKLIFGCGGERVEITILHISRRRRVELAIQAPASVRIERDVEVKRETAKQDAKTVNTGM